MKKNILISGVFLVIGILAEKNNIPDKVIKFGKDSWKTLKKKTEEYKEKIDENLQEIKEEVEETIKDKDK